MPITEPTWRPPGCDKFIEHRAARVKLTGFDYDAQPKEVVGKCAVCGQPGEPWAEKDKYGLAVTTRRCPDCGLIWISPRMTDKAYREFYQGTYRKLAASNTGRHDLSPAQIKADAQNYADKLIGWLTQCQPVVERMAAYRERGGLMVDIGGSTGAFALGIEKAFGLGVRVLDPAADEAAMAASAGVISWPLTVEEWQPLTNYDVIGCIQSIDHFLHPAESLAKICGALCRDGLFIVDFVDIETNIAKMGKDNAVKVDHPYNYSEQNIGKLLEAAGFRCVEAVREGRHLVYVCCKAEGSDGH